MAPEEISPALISQKLGDCLIRKLLLRPIEQGPGCAYLSCGDHPDHHRGSPKYAQCRMNIDDERAATVRAGISASSPHRQSKPKLSAQRTAIFQAGGTTAQRGSLSLVQPTWHSVERSERNVSNSGKLGLADCVLEVENLTLKLRMISKSSAYPTTVVQVVMTGGGRCAGVHFVNRKGKVLGGDNE
jgi:hypothetical protein